MTRIFLNGETGVSCARKWPFVRTTSRAQVICLSCPDARWLRQQASLGNVPFIMSSCCFPSPNFSPDIRFHLSLKVLVVVLYYWCTATVIVRSSPGTDVTLIALIVNKIKWKCSLCYFKLWARFHSLLYQSYFPFLRSPLWAENKKVLLSIFTWLLLALNRK